MVQTATDTMSPSKSPVPDNIVSAVKKGECILFLGAMVSSLSPMGCPFQYIEGPPGGGELSKRLAKRCGYPLEDSWNLARVSLYYETHPDFSRELLVKAIAEEVGSSNLVPSPALYMLASLPFPIIVTTNYDRLFEMALRDTELSDQTRKDPIIRIYDPRGQSDKVPLRPTAARPVLLKLHGDIEKPESIVVTEEDYITFIQKMSDHTRHPIPKAIQMYMTDWPIIFIGYSLKDYNLRLLLRTLRWTIDPANFPLCYSVDPQPDNLIVAVWQNGAQKLVRFLEQDLWDFVPALYTQCTGMHYVSHANRSR